MPTEVKYHLVDVFAERPLTGNPLAVVPDADGLPTDQMRAIAAEFNLSETTFLVNPTLTGADRQLRSYTPGGVEVGGAGHNALGAWLWMAAAGRLDADVTEFTQQIGEELLPVRVRRGGAPGERVDGGGATEVTLDQSSAEFGALVDDHSALAEALHVAAADLLTEYPAQVVSTGAGHLLINARSREVVDSADPDSSSLAMLLARAGGEGAYLYSLDPLEPERGSVAYARFFNPTVGIAEDPATGTAAGPLVALLAARGAVPHAATVAIEQGYQRGRPSRLLITIAGERIQLSGGGLVVADGVLHL